MLNTETTKSWLQSELVRALGFEEVDEIVAYIVGTFSSKKEVMNYLIELLGIPATRAEHISTTLFLLETSSGEKVTAHEAVPAAAQGKKQERSHRLTAADSRLKFNKTNQKNAATAMQRNNALVINCLQCGRIEYNGAQRCVFCDTELRYEVDAGTADHAAQQHMEELVRLDETGTARTRVFDYAEQYFYDEEPIDSTARRPITMTLDLDNKQFIDVKIVRNEHLSQDARELVESVQRNISKGKRGKGSIHQPTSLPSRDDIDKTVVEVDDSYNLLYV